MVGVLFYIGLGVFQFNFVVFLKDVYHWSPAFIGGMLTLVGVCDIVTRALLLPWLLKLSKEESIGIAGLIGLAIGLGCVVASLYFHSVVIVSLATIGIISGTGLFEPIYNGTLSQSIDEAKQGKLQGVNQSLQSANNVLVPLGAAAIYYYSPSVLYAAASVVILLAVLMYTNIWAERMRMQ